MDESAGSSPVRRWILKTLKNLLPSESSEIRSDTNGNLFRDWTGMTQADLEAIWIAEDTQRAINNLINGAGADPSLLKFKKGAQKAIANAKAALEKRRKLVEEMSRTGKKEPLPSLLSGVGVTTTCNAFLGVVVRKALNAGGLAQRSFSSFDLPKAGTQSNSWNWFPAGNKSPQPGDFYQAGTRGGFYEHVGIIMDIQGSTLSTADSGQGGPSSGYDAIKRKSREISKIMGWIDADAFFKGWNGPEL